MESGVVLFEIVKSLKQQQQQSNNGESSAGASTSSANDKTSNIGRFVRYNFTPDFLKLKTIGAR